jgi:hypothetical protein
VKLRTRQPYLFYLFICKPPHTHKNALENSTINSFFFFFFFFPFCSTNAHGLEVRPEDLTRQFADLSEWVSSLSPFFSLLLTVLLLDHWWGLWVALWLFSVLVHLNVIVSTQVARLAAPRAAEPSMLGLGALLACANAAIVYVLTAEDEPWKYLVYPLLSRNSLPTTRLELADVLFFAVLNDSVIRHGLVAVKCVMVAADALWARRLLRLAGDAPADLEAGGGGAGDASGDASIAGGGDDAGDSSAADGSGNAGGNNGGGNTTGGGSGGARGSRSSARLRAAQRASGHRLAACEALGTLIRAAATTPLWLMYLGQRRYAWTAARASVVVVAAMIGWMVQWRFLKDNVHHLYVSSSYVNV